MKKSAFIYIFKLIGQRFLGLVLYLIGSSAVIERRSLIYFANYFLMALVSALIIYRSNPEILAARNKINTDSPLWDKLLLGIYWLLSFFVIYLLAGIEAKKAAAIGIKFWIGMGLQLIAAAISLMAMLENSFLETTARIQTDRNQTVCKTGVYSIIRHPTYAAVLIWCASIILIFETTFTRLTSLLIALIILVRTYLEDKMLIRQLAGYKEYTSEVRYKIIPFIW